MKIKRLLLACLVTLKATLINAQTSDRFYSLNDATVLQECNKDGDTVGYKTKLAPSNFKFSIVNTVGGYYIIRFWALSNQNSVIKNFAALTPAKLANISTLSKTESITNKRYDLVKNLIKKIDLETDNLRYFRILKSEIDFYATKLVARFSPIYGAAVLPFKLRHQTGDFTKDLTLSNLGGIKISNAKGTFSYAFMLGMGITSASVDSLNTKGKVLKEQDRAAITIPVGVLLQWRKLQFGFFAGWDWLSKRSQDSWIYQGKNWFALGIGFSIFSEENAAKKEEKN